MSLDSQLLQGNDGKSEKKVEIMECLNCGSLYQKRPFGGCKDCDLSCFGEVVSKTVESAICSTCGNEIAYTRRNRINEKWNTFGYICSDCDNILELRFDGNWFEPDKFLQNQTNMNRCVVPVDSSKRENIMYIFSLQTKIEDVGFLAYKPNEYQPWLAIVNGEYCGYVTLNKDNAINQIWVDKGYRNRGVGEMLVKHICNVILSDNEQVRITTPTDVGKRFFKSISDNGEVFGKKLLYW